MPEECNIYETLWNRDEQAGFADDILIHIEDASGKKITYKEFHSRVLLAATALDKPFSDGKAEMIGILSHGSSVSRGERFSVVNSYLP